ncbi:hypothetical protein EVAR_22115_1 [Eumeta japonica]|uniref:Uncharacterized protein n=1 Tax=Eumeta variegata TaxID=151549 RepID=A0A4C1VZH4_EUMVA|nr:hypothetical protein EVAR_22115_1 [Eumeta japonica]
MLTDEFKEGRLKLVVVPQNIDALRELIMSDRHVIYSEIKASLGIIKRHIARGRGVYGSCGGIDVATASDTTFVLLAGGEHSTGFGCVVNGAAGAPESAVRPEEAPRTSGLTATGGSGDALGTGDAVGEAPQAWARWQ